VRLANLLSPHRGPSVALLLVAAGLPLSAAACGGEAMRGVGTSHARRPNDPVELSLRTVSGAEVAVEDQRGAPCLLFVVTTYDGVSQAAIREVSAFASAHLDTVVLAIVAQPDAATFARLYDETFEPPYTVVYEDGDTVQQGTSDLGPFDAVPAFYMLGADGRVVDRYVGWISEDRLAEMYDAAIAHGGITTAAPEPAETALDEAPTE
jgi:hypothetical protein